MWYITVNFHVSIFIFKINTIRNDRSIPSNFSCVIGTRSSLVSNLHVNSPAGFFSAGNAQGIWGENI